MAPSATEAAGATLARVGPFEALLELRIRSAALKAKADESPEAEGPFDVTDPYAGVSSWHLARRALRSAAEQEAVRLRNQANRIVEDAARCLGTGLSSRADGTMRDRILEAEQWAREILVEFLPHLTMPEPALIERLRCLVRGADPETRRALEAALRSLSRR